MDLTTLLYYCHYNMSSMKEWFIYLLIWKCKAKPRSIQHVTQKSTTKINKYGEKETPCPTNLKNKDET
jgi:hypothetical protein